VDRAAQGLRLDVDPSMQRWRESVAVGARRSSESDVIAAGCRYQQATASATQTMSGCWFISLLEKRVNYCGSANATIASPGLARARGLPPATMTTYWRPLTS
jgi:hypothetical protein